MSKAEFEKKFVCKQCGECCRTVGRTFWKVGDYSHIPELNALQANGDHEDGGLPCEMLAWRENKAVCLVQERYGHGAKPEVCRIFPEDGGLCFAEQKAGQKGLWE